MKRTLLLSLCLGAIAMVASAVPTGYVGSIAYSTTGTGNTVNGTGGGDGSTLDFTTSPAALAQSPSINLSVVANISDYLFVNLGTISGESDIDGSGCPSCETNNLGTMVLTFTFAVAGENKVIVLTGDIDADGSEAELDFPGHVNYPGGLGVTQFQYANGAVMEFVIYASNSIDSGNTITLTEGDPTDPIYMKIGLLQGPRTGVPEPGSMALLGSGLLGLGYIARRRAVRK